MSKEGGWFLEALSAVPKSPGTLRAGIQAPNQQMVCLWLRSLGVSAARGCITGMTDLITGFTFPAFVVNSQTATDAESRLQRGRS